MPARHQRIRIHALDDFAALVRRHVAKTDNAVLRLGFGDARFDDFGDDAQGISRTNCMRPAQLVNAETDRAMCEIQRLNEESHCHCRSVPSACDKALENTSLRRCPIEMKHLRVEFMRELNDLRFADSERI